MKGMNAMSAATTGTVDCLSDSDFVLSLVVITVNKGGLIILPDFNTGPFSLMR
jgi:hypothetical protein